MASFRDDPDELQRLDWSLLQNGPVTLYFRQTVLEEDVGWLLDHGYVVNRLDCRVWKDAASAMEEFARELQFPDYFGKNLNALNDCLGDLNILDRSGRAVVLEHFDRAVSFQGPFCAAVLDILANQSRAHLLFGRRLLALVQSDDPRLALGPVGATPVTWNRREWLDKSRGA